MKVIIAGSRNICDFALLRRSITESGFNITEVVSGHCPTGVDDMGEFWCRRYLKKEPTLFPADWDTHGHAAGPIRNQQMADYGEALILIWDGKSRGSLSMLNAAKRKGIPIYSVTVTVRTELLNGR